MQDGLIARVKRLISGRVHDLVDAIETAAPEAVMRETLREMDSATDEVRDALGRIIANRHHASKRLIDATSKHKELSTKAQFAIEQGRDDLAEAAIAKQIDLEAQIPVLEATIGELSAEQAELEGYIAALLARKREMEADLNSFNESRMAPRECADAKVPAVTHGLRADKRADAAECAFNRVLKQSSGLDASPRSDSSTSAKLAELETIERTHRVQERLAALKAGHV